jgi:hypothetical protein
MLDRVFEDYPYVPLILATATVTLGFVVAYL